jgi:flagellar capping protein FliD
MNKTYTNEEILRNIEILTQKRDSIKIERTALTQTINSLNKQILMWEKLDKSQYKMFDE